MCGILASLGIENNLSTFRDCLLLMKHRGPDMPGCVQEYCNGYIKMGHNRLSIIDLNSRSNQPYLSRNKKFAIIFNGEIYNYLEVAKKYSINLRTTSDTELILEGYIKFGPKIINSFIGMFAFIIVNLESGDFFVARDRLGVKPLYYWNNNSGSYIFSSELNPICALINNYKIDDISLRQYKNLRNYYNGRTIYSNIKSFPAGCYMENGKTTQYWSYNIVNQIPPSDEELRDLVVSAIKYRMVSDVPVGAFLSGGLDSTIVATISGCQNTWSVGTELSNEFKWAKLVANHISSHHHDILVTKNEFLTSLQKMISVTMQPMTVPNSVLIFLLSMKASKKNKVMLCGEGADELFYGYDRIYRWANNTKNFKIREFAELYSYGRPIDYEIVEDAIKPFLDYGSPSNIVQAFMQTSHLSGLLNRLDIASMLAGVEARAPFTDHRLVERMAGVSFNYNIQGQIVKASLKRIFSDIIPSPILHRQKVGFPVDLEKLLTQTNEKNIMNNWFNTNITLFKRKLYEIAK